MSVKAMNWVWECSQAVGNNRLVLLAIADRCQENGAGAWPALEDLQAKTLLSESTVRRCIQALIKSGELETKARKGRTNTYRIRYESRSAREAAPARTDEPSHEGCQIDTPAQLEGVSLLKPRQIDRGVSSERGGVSPDERGGVSAVTPEPSLTSSTSVPRAVREDRRTNDGQRIRVFLAWWCDTYRQHLRATYRVVAKRDVNAVRQLLELYGEDGLKAMCVLLFTEKQDAFITKSDRGVGVLLVKASWLASRRAEAERRVAVDVSFPCQHVPRCNSRLICEHRKVHPERYQGMAV